MLALHRQIARQIRRAGLHDLDAVPRQFRFVFTLVLASPPRLIPDRPNASRSMPPCKWQQFPVTCGTGITSRCIQIVQRKDRFEASIARMFFEIFLEKQGRRSGHARDVVGVDEAIRP